MQSAPGQPHPMGATILPMDSNATDLVVNFALLTDGAPTAVVLCLYLDASVSRDPDATIPMERTGDVWHVLVRNVPPFACYAYGVSRVITAGGRPTPRTFYVADPYSRQLGTRSKWGVVSKGDPTVQCSVILFDPHFEWNGDRPCVKRRASPYSCIYELHVRGFTVHPSSGAASPGSFLGVVEKIPHLLQLGVTMVELLPIFEFNELAHRNSPRLVNYWGYAPEFFFAPMGRYGNATDFKIMVRELHKHGIDVILDVVFNHTGGICLEAIGRNIYYIIANGKHTNYSGCGNTLCCASPAASFLIADCLRYWVEEMHVDGFRFDEAPILLRTETGALADGSPLLQAMAEDPVLNSCRFISESWDAGGAYTLGNFAAKYGWSEWNGKFRDTVRSFVKGTDGFAGIFASCICGSSEVYGKNSSPTKSINFITCHDGFSLYDLVSYNSKHNEANNEGNRDGIDNNLSWNCGSEGGTEDPHILTLRQKQMRNMILALVVSRGTPMILMGDEYGHTKQGNNNAWCQDSALNWFHWNSLAVDTYGLARFTSLCLRFRSNHHLLCAEKFVGSADIEWHGTTPNNPDWSPTSRLVAFTLKDVANSVYIFVAFNAYWTPKDVELPHPDKVWLSVINTAQAPPNDFCEENPPPAPIRCVAHGPNTSSVLTMEPYSSMLLIAAM